MACQAACRPQELSAYSLGLASGYQGDGHPHSPRLASPQKYPDLGFRVWGLGFVSGLGICKDILV